MIKPPPLKPNALIRMVSPSSPIEMERLEKSIRLLESWGYRIELAPHAFDADYYLAGKDEDRAKDLMEAFFDPSVDCVFCTRGGYGAARLFPHLDFDAMAATGKMFCGFSDITTLHLALNRRGLATLHAPMGLSLNWDREPWIYESLKSWLVGDSTLPAEVPPAKCIVPGTAEGEVTGGCVILLCDAIGTANPLNAKGKILLLEDVDEDPHRIDAMFTHLFNSGSLEGVAGFVVGEMTRTDERHEPSIGQKPWRSIVRERLEPLGIPTVMEYPFGHMGTMLTMPLGLKARLDADRGTVTYLEGL